MHGFVGCLERNKSAVDCMTQWVRHWMALSPANEEVVIEHPPFTFVGSRRTDAPVEAVSDDTGMVLGYRGFVTKDELRKLADPGHAGGSDVPSLLLSAYQVRGAAALAGLNGRYIVWVWDPAEGKLELINDVLGLKPVFVWHGGDSFAFASNVWPIVCRPDFRKGIDLRGMVDLLLLGHQQGQRTLLDGISVLPPGSVSSFQGGAFTSRCVRHLRFSRARWDWSVERAADEMYRILSASVRRQVPERSEVLLPLSGGFDSRVLLGFLSQRQRRAHTVTWWRPGLGREDAACARRLARHAGTHHTTFKTPDDFLARYRERCVAINGGTYDGHTAATLCLLDNFARCQAVLVSGHLGGELTSRFQISDAAFSTPEEHFEIAFRNILNHRFTPDVVRRALGSGLPDDLVDESVEENKQLMLSGDGPFFHRFFNWDLMSHRRRYISYLLFYADQFAQVRAPFYDIEFLDFICSLPFAALYRQHAYRAMLGERFPALAKVPNTNDLPVLASTREALRDFARTQYRRFVQAPLDGFLGFRLLDGHPFERYGELLAARGSSAVLDHILRSRGRLSQYLDLQRVQECVERQRGGDSSFSMGVLGLSAFATALEMLEDPYRAVRAWQEEGRGLSAG